MENSSTKSVTGLVQLLLKTDQDFPEKLKQYLVLESNKVKNPYKFLVRLFIEGVLSNESSDPEANCGQVQLAMATACSKDADAIDGLMKALEDSGNSQFISALCNWVQEEFGMESHGALREPKGGTPVVRTGTSDKSPKKGNSSREMKAIGTKLIDKIIAQLDEDLIQNLEGYLVSKASKILNAPQMCSDLVHQNILDERDYQLKTTPKAQRKQWASKAIKEACSKRAIGSLVLALQNSHNELILAEVYEWLETSPGRKKNYPIAVKSLENQRNQQEAKAVESTFFQQAPISDGLSKIGTFKWEQKPAATGISFVQFDRERMMACSAGGELNLWSSQGNKQENIRRAVKVEKITCFQYDDEVLVLGTAAGTVHLFDAKSFEEKWLVRLADPVKSLKFVQSALITHTRSAEQEEAWWMEISRPDMQLVHRKPLFSWSGCENRIQGVWVHPETSFVLSRQLVPLLFTKSGQWVLDDDDELCCLKAPADISTLHIGDLISTKGIVVAGCINGVIAMWNTSKWMRCQSPVKTFQRNSEAIVSMCSLNGHLLSLDESGTLLMWSGHDMENKCVTPVPRVLDESLSNVTSLAAHERWFASYSSKDAVINIWTLPDLWLRTG